MLLGIPPELIIVSGRGELILRTHLSGLFSDFWLFSRTVKTVWPSHSRSETLGDQIGHSCSMFPKGQGEYAYLLVSNIAYMC